jgi:hypothetical protein
MLVLLEVSMQDNQALLITYASGSTPGDSYMWFVDQNYRPKAWRMWGIIPVDWKQLGKIGKHFKTI